MQRLKLLKKWTEGPKLLLAGAEQEAQTSSSPAVQQEESSSPAVQQQAESRPAEIKKTAYSWAGSSEEGRRNLNLFIQACDSVWPIVSKPIASCSDYMERVDEAYQAVAEPGMKRVPVFHAHYGGPWVLRALLLALLRSRGVTALGGTAAVSTSSFNQAVPDQCDWVARLCSHADRAGARSRQTFKDFLDYAGLTSEPPEYCSMHLCIWGSSLLPEDTVQLLREDVSMNRMLVLQYKLQHGMWPHPLTFLEMKAAKQKAASSSPAVQGHGETATVPVPSCPAVQGPQRRAKPATSNAPATDAARPKAQNCSSRGGAVQKRPATVRRRKSSKSSQ